MNARKTTKSFDDNIVCPISASDLHQIKNRLVSENGDNKYEIDEQILRLFVQETAEGFEKATLGVQDFYTEAPFPNYNEFDDVGTFVRRAHKSVFAKLLSDQIPSNSNVLEVGCGTGQLSNYLAATAPAHIYAADMTFDSLKLGVDFANKNKLKGIKFLQMNLFCPCIRKESMDIVISNGVLHHTADTRKAFLSIAPLVKPGGHIIIGLYNKIGRLRTDFRRHLYRVFGKKVLVLDPHLRKNLSADKRRAWIRDQYIHPEEHKHTMSETLGWFDEAGFKFVSAIPKIKGSFQADEKLFEPKSAGTAIDRTMAEIEMLFSHFGGEGGLYIMIGHKL